MSRNRKKKGKKTNILLGFICILLVGLLGFLLAMNYKTEQEESQRLTELAGDQHIGIEDYDAVKEHAAELEKASKDEEESSETDNTDKKSKKNNQKEDAAEADDTENAEENADEETARTISGVVCWGDDLINGDASNTYSYMAVLQKLLTDNGYNLTVVNKTLQAGGTLSMMKMAGVSDETLQGYITKHQQAANGAQMNVTETGIRDLTEEETTRNDMDCIPVIFMGYYGGWNHDPAELAEQQEQILNTFQYKDDFIVVGTIPLDGSVTADALDQVLSQKWGEHYISLASVTAQPSATYEAQQAMGEAVFNKLQELGYITKD
ncbi:hypothetical protein [Blautia sp. MSJ-9]|uniref:hypothetical protein n=1 Tax=Blautia sp. MSJ-9 TaxID=2841511 RepID=UPI001C11A08D|nr:hypothetical protein [Blautia sp. MSJ-9]